MGNVTFLTEIWNEIQLANAFNAFLEGVSDQVATLLPMGVGIMLVLAIPRVIKRVVGTFI
jgi:hypothetical protein